MLREKIHHCQFISDHEMKLMVYDNSTWLEGETIANAHATATMKERTIRSKKIIIATGAALTLPRPLVRASSDAGVPYYTEIS